MKTQTRKQLESTKRRAELAAANLRGDEDRADEFANMSIEDYAALRGIAIQNPKKGGLKMASRIKQLEAELDEANARIEELESERDGVLDALGVEVVDDDSDSDNDGDE
jgi:hypothetical protein